MKVDAQGWLTGCRHVVSENCDARPNAQINLLVIHNISLPPNEFGGDGVERLFTNTLDANAHPYYQSIAALKVSAHFFIRRDGEIIQFVSCQNRAWHAGVSCWQGVPRCNDYSLGVELEGCDTMPFSAAQYRALQHLTQVLRDEYHFAGIAGHSDIAPQRKTDPGECFNWLRYLISISET